MSLPARAVCLDAQGAQSPQHHDRGIARYVVEHVRALHRAHPEALHSVLLNPTLALTGNLSWLVGKGLLGWSTADRRSAKRPAGTPAIYHVMSPFEVQSIDALWPIWARRSDIRTVLTLYDLIPLVFADHYLRDPAMRAGYQTRLELLRRADHILAISRTTAEDAMERLEIPPQRITVIDAGATEKFASMYSSPAAAWELLHDQLPAIRPGYMLYVAGFEFRKNLERVIAAYGMMSAEVRTAHQLVIACKLLPSEAELIESWAARAGIEREQLILTGYVSDIALGALYHACTLFVFASLYEGSGLPILEAMSCGAPVAASRTSTGPEILGDLRATFDPHDPGAIAQCLTATLDSPSTLAELTERSHRRVVDYTWDHVARQSVGAYEQVIADPPPRRRSRRARLALVTPWPPEQSGVADYSFRLARELGEHVDVDVVVDNPLDTYAPPQERGVQLVHASAFRGAERMRQHDRILYCMGNSAFHGHVYELLRERPGAVLAHDVRLTGFYRWFSGREHPDDPAGRARERIQALYGPRLVRSAIAHGMPGWNEQAALGIYMTREIQQYAEQLFVHSHHAREVLELDRAPLDRPVPISVLAHAFPIPTARSYQPSGNVPSIATFGVVSEIKGLSTLIGAVALLAEQRPDTRLTIAGPGEPAELERWRELAREIAPAAEVTLTGHLERTHYERLLREVDVAVQLRTISNGETSGAIVDCLAAGLPTVVSDLGWASELPLDVVSHVPVDCTASGLAGTLERLVANEQARRELGKAAQRHAQAHSFPIIAAEYIRLLELI